MFFVKELLQISDWEKLLLPARTKMAAAEQGGKVDMSLDDIIAADRKSQGGRGGRGGRSGGGQRNGSGGGRGGRSRGAGGRGGDAGGLFKTN